jgi:hypothetical protein
MTVQTATRPTPPAWVTHLDTSGNGIGVTFPVLTIPDTSVLVEWTPQEGAIVWINEDRYTRREIVAVNVGRLEALEAVAATLRDDDTVSLAGWDDEPLTLVQALDLVGTTSLVIAVSGSQDRTAEQTLTALIAKVKS